MKWTDVDCEYLLSNYEHKTVAEISDHLGRTRNSVRGKLHSLGLVAKREVDLWWSEEEVARLKEILKTGSKEDAAKILGRSLSSVKHRCFRHKLKPAFVAGRGKHAGKVFRVWEPHELNWLLCNAGSVSIKEAAEKLNRSPKAVHEKCKALNVSWVGWKISLNALGEFFGVSPTTVTIHKRKLGHSWDRYTPPTNEEIRELAGSMLESDQIMTRAKYLRRIRDGQIDPEEFMAVRGTPYGKEFIRHKYNESA